MKFTKFYLDKVLEIGDLILYNTFSGKVLKIKKENVSIVKNLLNQDRILEDNSECQRILKETGFLIDDSIDEFKVAETWLDKVLNNRKVLSITIMPTELCNFRCVYCYEDHKKGPMNKETIESTIKYIKEKIPKIKSLNIAWFGGEPLLEIDKIKYISEILIEECKKYGVTYRAYITTNGYLLSYDNFLLLYKKCRVYAYQITLDGNKNTHDKQRFLSNGAPTFEVIFNNLKEIQSHKENRFFYIDIRTNLTKYIYENSFISYINLLNDTFGNDTRFSLIWRKTFGISEEESITQEQYLNLFNLLLDKNLNINSEYRLSLPIQSICSAAKQGNIVIGSDGTVYKCTVAFDRDINKLGNINNYEMLDQNKVKFWETPRRNNGLYQTECRNCQVYPICLGCMCPNNMYSNDGLECKRTSLDALKEKIILFANSPYCIEF